LQFYKKCIIIRKNKEAESVQLQESGEMYLETILLLSKKKPSVRSIDVADERGYSKPSVSRAVGLLKTGGFITVHDAGEITLTDLGYEIANKIYERHTVLTEVFKKIGVSEETAVEDACRIEHVISDKTFEAIKKLL